MSFLGSMFSGASGFSPQQAHIDKPATTAQANEQYGNVQSGLGNQAAFLQAVQQQNGLQNQAQVFQQQQQLAQQLQQQAAGGGPNPALDQLNQQTGNNTANQAALMAGQRGTGANAGMIARQAAMQGGANQQQAAGQGATMQAQQQIAAQQQLGQQQNNMQGVAGNQVGTQANATNAYSNSAQNALGQVYGQINAQNNAALGQTQLNNQGQKDQHTMDNQLGGQFLGAVSQAAGPMGTMLSGMGGGGGGAQQGVQGTMAGGPMDAGNMMSAMPMMVAAHGGMAPNVSGPRSKAAQHLSGLAMKQGGPVPGQAKVAGDSYANDNVHALLSPGEIVIPRHITQGADAPKKAAAFVQAILAKQGPKK